MHDLKNSRHKASHQIQSLAWQVTVLETNLLTLIVSHYFRTYSRAGYHTCIEIIMSEAGHSLSSKNSPAKNNNGRLAVQALSLLSHRGHRHVSLSEVYPLVFGVWVLATQASFEQGNWRRSELSLLETASTHMEAYDSRLPVKYSDISCVSLLFLMNWKAKHW